jgi:hypothetical protein
MKNKNFMKYAFVVLGLALGVCASAHGMAFNQPGHPAPEVDPGLAIRAITLLAGSLAVMRIRRQK